MLKGHGYPVEVSTPEMINKIPNMVLSDQRIKLCEIIETTQVSKGTAVSILHDELDMREIFATWVPHLLSVENKHNRVVISETLSAHICHNLNKFPC